MIYSARVKARRFVKWHFTASLCGKAVLQERPRMSRAEYTLADYFDLSTQARIIHR